MSVSRRFSFFVLAALTVGVAVLFVSRQRRIDRLRLQRAALFSQVRAIAQETTTGESSPTPGSAESSAEQTQRLRLISIWQTVLRLPRIPLADAWAAAPLSPPTNPHGGVFFGELMGNPDYARLCTVCFRQEAEDTNGTILARLRNDPGKVARLVQLLVDRRFVDLESDEIAREQGLFGVESAKARYRARDAIDDEIRAVAGDELYRKLN
jgi:type II secretory pathway pseudopilin PulG